MKNKNSIVKNTLIITAFAMTVKLMGMLFRLYLAGRMGTEGMGLYQLIMSVYGLFTTLSTAGLTVTVSGLASRKLITEGIYGANALLKRSIRLSLFAAVPAGLVMLLFSPVISQYFVGDIRVMNSLRILSFSMPFMGIASCFKGWFFALTQPVKPSIASVLEQTVKICFTVLFLGTFARGQNSPQALCAGTVLGITLGECFSALVLFVMYRKSLTPAAPCPTDKKENDKALVNMCLPIGAGAVLSGLLHTCESVLIPKMLTVYGGDYKQALSDFGIIRGMAIPLLFFPFSLLSSLISVTVPEISKLKAMKDPKLLGDKVSKILTYSWAFSIFAGGLFFMFPAVLAKAFYNSEESVNAIRILAAVTPMMYIETVTDGMLKSMGQQMWTFITGLINSAVRILAVMFYIPESGADGYLLLLTVSNIYSYAMCAYRMRMTAHSSPNPYKGVILPMICVCAGGAAAYKTLNVFSSPYPKAILVTAVYCLCGAVIYFIGTKLWNKSEKRQSICH